jgi:hypothetical protein
MLLLRFGQRVAHVAYSGPKEYLVNPRNSFCARQLWKPSNKKSTMHPSPRSLPLKFGVPDKSLTNRRTRHRASLINLTWDTPETDVTFQVVTTTSMRMVVFWMFSLVQTDRRFRGACCFHHQDHDISEDIALIEEPLKRRKFLPDYAA